MNKKTLAALISGVEKWERNALVKSPEEALIYQDSCELCALFISKGCRGCPVMVSSGKDGCNGTPWERADDALYDWENIAEMGDARDNRNARARFRRAAKAEANFLRSLLPTTGEPQ